MLYENQDISKNVNDLHSQGHNAFNQQGMDFFVPLAEQKHAAGNLYINPEIIGDVGRIVAAIDPNRPGDNRIANMIGDLQHKKALFDGETSIDEFYNGLIAELGIRTQKVNRQAHF